MTGIVAALQAVVIMRGYSRICGDTSAEMHTGTPSAALQVLGDHALVGRVDVGVEQAHARPPRRRGRGTCAGERVEAGSRRASTTHAPVGRRALVQLEGPVPRDGRGGNSICRSYMS